MESEAIIKIPYKEKKPLAVILCFLSRSSEILLHLYRPVLDNQM